MKIMFNKICGKVVIDTIPVCKSCVFENTEYCKDLNLFTLCKSYKFLKSNIDIFEL